MKNILKLYRILEYYDVPQVFIGTDRFCAKYLCMLFDDSEEYKYVAIPISPERIAQFINGEVDLRSLYLYPEMGELYHIVSYHDSILEISDTINGNISEDMLPEEGFIYNNNNENDPIIEETIALKHPVIHIGFVDSNNSHSIEVPVLSSALNYYQSLVSHCYTKIDGREKNIDPKLRVSIFTAASFNVHLYSEATFDLFNSSGIEYTLIALDKIFRYTNDEEFRTKLATLKGHTIGSYKKLIKLLIDNNLSFKYKWISSYDGFKVVNNKIEKLNLEKIYKVLEESNELENEIKEFVGVFTKVDTSNGNWKILDNINSKIISGISNDPNLLSGITVNTITYTIVCKEVIESNNVNVGEKIIYQLESITNIE